MGKVVGVAELKAHCTRLLREPEQDGEPITITDRGKPVAVVKPASRDMPEKRPIASAFGMLRNEAYRFEDPFSPASDDAEWDANNPAGLYRQP